MEGPLVTSLNLSRDNCPKKAEKSYAILSKQPLRELALMCHRPGNLSQTLIYSSVAFEPSLVPNWKNSILFSSASSASQLLEQTKGDSIAIIVLSFSEARLVSILLAENTWSTFSTQCKTQYTMSALDTLGALRCLPLLNGGGRVEVKSVICASLFFFFWSQQKLLMNSTEDKALTILFHQSK